MNTNLTKQDYQNLANILDTIDIKGRKSAEYIAILGMKLDARVRDWYDGNQIGIDYSKEVSAEAKVLASLAISDRDREILERET